jgi:hypothetical protein
VAVGKADFHCSCRLWSTIAGIETNPCQKMEESDVLTNKRGVEEGTIQTAAPWLVIDQVVLKSKLFWWSIWLRTDYYKLSNKAELEGR